MNNTTLQSTSSIVIEGWSLALGDDQEPRVRDVDLAGRLDLARPRKIRDLVKRMIEEREISNVLVRPTVGRGRNQHGETSATQTIDEYWLTEEQSLLVTIRSDAPKAAEVRAAIVRVFRAAIRGQIGAIDPAVIGAMIEHAVAPLREANARLTEDNRRLGALLVQRTEPSTGALGRERGDVFRASIARFADRLTLNAPRVSIAWKRARGNADTKLRRITGHAMLSWNALPETALHLANLMIEELHRDLDGLGIAARVDAKARERANEETTKARQGKLWS